MFNLNGFKPIHKVLKYTKSLISKALAMLFNKSLTVCQFQDLWKEGLYYATF